MITAEGGIPETGGVPFATILGNTTQGIGFDAKAGVRRGVLRRTVDYSATIVRHLENRVWQRDARDTPAIQPDSTYFNELVIPAGLEENPVNAVTTKFVRASTNKVRCPIFCTSWVPDGRRLITGASSGEFTLWNGQTFNFESILQGHDCPVRSMTWSHDGVWMVSTDDRGFVKYWQSNMNNVHTFQAHNEPVRCSSFSPTDNKLVTCSDDGTVRTWDFLRCSEEFILRGHGADVKYVDWHPRRSLIVSGSKDNQQPVILWDPKAGKSVSTIHAHKATVMCVKWNENGNWLLTASRDHLIKIYDIRAMKEMCILRSHKKDVNIVAWHPVHESFFASGGSDGAILFWLVGNEREIGGMESAHDSFIWSLSWHPLGHILCSGSNDHTSKFWCRNRPGDEMKDKYNSFVNPLLSEEAPDIDSFHRISLPGMGANKSSSSAITLPPPSSHRSAPEPTGDTFQQRGTGVKVDIGIPVLGADIIAQQFGTGPRKPPESPHNVPHDQRPPSDNVAPNFNEQFFGSREKWEPPPPQAPHGRMGPGPMPHPQTPPEGFRGPPPPLLDQRQREWHRDDFGGRPGHFRPGNRPPPGEFPDRNPYIWQRPELRNRRPSEEDRRFYNEPVHNPYVFRRSDNEPRDPRQMMGGDPRRFAQERWGGEPRPWSDDPQRPPPQQPPMRRPSEEFPDRGRPPPPPSQPRGPLEEFDRHGNYPHGDTFESNRFPPPVERRGPPPSQPKQRENWPPHERPPPSEQDLPPPSTQPQFHPPRQTRPPLFPPEQEGMSALPQQQIQRPLPSHMQETHRPLPSEMQETHRPSPPHMQDIHRPPPPHMQDSHRPPPAHMQETHRPSPAHIQDVHRPPPSHMQDVHRPSPSLMQETHRPSPPHMQDVHRPPPSHMQDIHRPPLVEAHRPPHSQMHDQRPPQQQQSQEPPPPLLRQEPHQRRDEHFHGPPPSHAQDSHRPAVRDPRTVHEPAPRPHPMHQPSEPHEPQFRGPPSREVLPPRNEPPPHLQQQPQQFEREFINRPPPTAPPGRPHEEQRPGDGFFRPRSDEQRLQPPTEGFFQNQPGPRPDEQRLQAPSERFFQVPRNEEQLQSPNELLFQNQQGPPMQRFPPTSEQDFPPQNPGVGPRPGGPHFQRFPPPSQRQGLRPHGPLPPLIPPSSQPSQGQWRHPLPRGPPPTSGPEEQFGGGPNQPPFQPHGPSESMHRPPPRHQNMSDPRLQQPPQHEGPPHERQGLPPQHQGHPPQHQGPPLQRNLPMPRQNQYPPLEQFPPQNQDYQFREQQGAAPLPPLMPPHEGRPMEGQWPGQQQPLGLGPPPQQQRGEDPGRDRRRQGGRGRDKDVDNRDRDRDRERDRERDRSRRDKSPSHRRSSEDRDSTSGKRSRSDKEERSKSSKKSKRH